MRLTRFLSATTVAAAATFAAAAAPASAGVLVASAPNCAAETLSQPFLPWLDPSHYTLVPGGDFESGAAGWALSGGAAVTAGNESSYVTAATDAHSLSLPAGSSATSTTQCVGIDHPTLRLFARNTGSSLSVLHVDVNWEDGFGNVQTTPVGDMSAGGAWTPTPPSVIASSLLPLLPGSMTPVQFTFTPVGPGNWQVDDVYVDPWGRG